MNVRIFALLFFAVLTGLVSCKDKDLPQATPLQAYLNVVNATPDTIKYYINGTRQNNTSNLFVGGQTGYLYVPSGTQNYKFSDAVGKFPVLFATTYSLADSTYYSLFVAGTTPDKAFVIADPLSLADTILVHGIADTSAVIRFVNASPDSGPLNVTVGAGDTVNFTNQAFGTHTNFTLFNAGAKEVKVFQTGSGTPKIDTTITFQPGNIYTLFTKGSVTGKGTATFSVTLTN
jgi:plastocyanin